MRTNPLWHGVRLRTVRTGADPDAFPRQVTIPADWDDTAAAALAALAPGAGPARLDRAAEAWIGPLARACLSTGLATRLHRMLLHRQGAPAPAIWRGEPLADARFVLNLAAFVESGFETAAFDEAVETGALALAVAAPEAATLTLGVTDLAGLIAAHGAEYGSPQGRAIARLVLTRLRARAGAAAAHPLLAGRTLRVGADAPGPVDALLGAETGGIAPAFAPVGTHGLTRAARAFLAARGLSADAALAAELAGQSVFERPGEGEHRAMRTALADLLDTMQAQAEPARLPAAPETAAAGRRELPARHAGYTQKATLGGHRIYIRTGEYPDGTLGELSIALPKDSAAVRGLMEAFAGAVSIGLQHGVPLSEYVEAFVQTRFGPSGKVEGDPAVQAATSVPDYVFRHLASNYLGQRDLPAAEPEEPPHPPAPLSLPLELPDDPRARRRNFRVVGS
ncbi:MAG TPA: TSCPD domain-containing protein [Acetobacteraceae bacterium]|nr:TSCPD domain-containing protein [Acetobacteraceae bacterium]